MTVVAPEAPQLRPPMARPLDVGDTAPMAHAPDHTGSPVSTGADLLAGKPILLLFCPARDEASLIAFRDSAAYAVDRGTAIVWSASLLHEVLPVTKGRRLVLGVHMYGA